MWITQWGCWKILKTFSFRCGNCTNVKSERPGNLGSRFVMCRHTLKRAQDAFLCSKPIPFTLPPNISVNPGSGHMGASSSLPGFPKTVTQSPLLNSQVVNAGFRRRALEFSGRFTKGRKQELLLARMGGSISLVVFICLSRELSIKM